MRAFSKSALLIALCLASSIQPGRASSNWTLTTLYSFAGDDGANPFGALIFDKSGALYGTTSTGGAGWSPSSPCVSPGGSCGTAFKLTSPVNKGGVWTKILLHTFMGSVEGFFSLSGLIFDKSGALYGTTGDGPGTYGEGTVFKLTPPTTSGGVWTATVLHTFTGTDGIQPYVGSLIFDKSGALYGTTNVGGLYNHGTVFKLTPPATTGGVWTETVLHNFEGGVQQGNTGGDDGSQPLGSLIFDKSGALYGTTVAGGSLGLNGGTVFKLTPPVIGNAAWTETVLHSFAGNDGLYPPAGVIFDKSGALYGTTQGGALGYGTVFKLTPPPRKDAVWTISVLHSFTQNENYPSYGNLVFDESGALYGATLFGGAFGHGTVSS